MSSFAVKHRPPLSLTRRKKYAQLDTSHTIFTHVIIIVKNRDTLRIRGKAFESQTMLCMILKNPRTPKCPRMWGGCPRTAEVLSENVPKSDGLQVHTHTHTHTHRHTHTHTATTYSCVVLHWPQEAYSCIWAVFDSQSPSAERLRSIGDGHATAVRTLDTLLRRLCVWPR